MNWRALSEHSELVRPPQASGGPLYLIPDGASMALGTFAETKGPRLPGRNPATSKIRLAQTLRIPVPAVLRSRVFWQRLRWIPESQGPTERPKPYIL